MLQSFFGVANRKSCCDPARAALHKDVHGRHVSLSASLLKLRKSQSPLSPAKRAVMGHRIACTLSGTLKDNPKGPCASTRALIGNRYQRSGSHTPAVTERAPIRLDREAGETTDAGEDAEVPSSSSLRSPTRSVSLPRSRPQRAGPGPVRKPRGWTRLHARLQHVLRVTKLLETESVLVAVSGGQDSVCLLQLLVDLQPHFRWRLGVVHCDHRWREDSDANAEFVRQLAGGLGLPFYLRVAPPGTARTERSAREWRYSVFAEVASEQGYDTAVTAHTATDRAETMMLNLLRGAGPDGLVALARSRALVPGREAADEVVDLNGAPASASGDEGAIAQHDACTNGSKSSKIISGYWDWDSSHGGSACRGSSPSGQIRLVRPLLEFTREETQAFVRQRALSFYHDVTNDCNDLRRNLLRNTVMPSLREQFNPRLDQALYRFMEVLGPEMEYMKRTSTALYDLVVVPQNTPVNSTGPATPKQEVLSRLLLRLEDGLGCGQRQEAPCNGVEALAIEVLQALPSALQRRVVHMWLRANVPKVVAEGDTEAEGLPGAAAGGGTEAEGRPSAAAGGGTKAEGLPGAAAGGGTEAEGRSSAAAGGGTKAKGRPGAAAVAGTETGALGAVRQRCMEVGFEDVVRCLALLDAPNGTNSDSLCNGLVATVRGGLLVLRQASSCAAGRPRHGRTSDSSWLGVGSQHGQGYESILADGLYAVGGAAMASVSGASGTNDGVRVSCWVEP